MKIKNIEFKAKVESIEFYEEKLLSLNPVFKGIDHQIDTYFDVPKGRLKLREGNIENSLINYDRSDTVDAKLSNIILYEHNPNPALKDILSLQLGIKVIVDKNRKIYFIENVKFHFDEVKELGTFLEVEAIDTDDSFSMEELKSQCDYYFEFFNLSKTNLIDLSYSDLIMKKANNIYYLNNSKQSL